MVHTSTSCIPSHTCKPQLQQMSEEPAAAAWIHSMPEDVVVRISEYWTSRQIHTFLLGTCSNDLRSAVVEKASERCADFLRQAKASEILQATWHEQSEAVLESLDDQQKLTEFTVFLEYCTEMPGKLAKRLQADHPHQVCWIVGTGALGSTSSPVMLSTPNWKPELLFLAEQWMNPAKPRKRHAPEPRHPIGFYQIERYSMSHFIPMEEEAFVRSSAIAVLAWKDDNFLKFMHEQVDMVGGLISYHKYQNSNLLWLPNASCNIHESIHRIVRESEHSWLLKAAEHDHNMLCSYEIDNGDVEPNHHVDGFGERIFKLLQAAEEWYPSETP